MRKLKLQVQQTINGFVGGPDGELDWMTWVWDEELKQFVRDLTEPVDTIIMGRKMAEGFIPYWEKVAQNPDDPEYEFGVKMNSTRNVVFSRTLEKSEWKNTVLAKGDLANEINDLKKQEGKDIIVYGGAEFVSNLIHEGLIDELYIFINPKAISNGLTIFNQTTGLKLVNSRSFSCGIVVLTYQPEE